eukprot:UN23355
MPRSESFAEYQNNTVLFHKTLFYPLLSNKMKSDLTEFAWSHLDTLFCLGQQNSYPRLAP